MKLAHIDNDVLAIGILTDSDRDIAIALFRLDMAMKATEASLEQWTMQRDAALARAIQCKRQNLNTAAMAELKRKALYESHLERARDTLLNLEQTQHAVQTAHSQAQIVRVLQETASTWKLVRQDRVTLEQVDNLSLDLAEELGHLNHDNTTLVQIAKDDFNDEELLTELQNLTLSEKGRIKTVRQSLSNEDDLSVSHQSIADETKPYQNVATATETIASMNDAMETEDANCVLPIDGANENETAIAL